MFQLLLSSASTASQPADWDTQEAGRDTVGIADPNPSERYPISYDTAPSSNIWGKRRRWGTFRVDGVYLPK